MVKHIGQTLRSTREALGLEVDDCADEAGLSVANYRDLEADRSEFFDNISMGTARRICKILRLDFLEVISTHLPVQISERALVNPKAFYSRQDLIYNARRRLGLSEEDLGDLVGFEAVMISQLERTPDFIETLPIVVIVKTAQALGVDPGRLISGLA
jgi:transcriptional regulator with XRE-family HTH domain